MHDTYNVVWKGVQVGTITDLEQDMWYMNGKWLGFDIPETKAFQHLLINADIATSEKDPVANAIKVILFNTQSPNRKIFCLATAIIGDEIQLRQIVAEEALNLLFPGR